MSKFNFSNLFGKVEMEEAAERICESASDVHEALEGFKVIPQDVIDVDLEQGEHDALLGMLWLLAYGWIEMDEDEQFKLSKEFIEKVTPRLNS